MSRIREGGGGVVPQWSFILGGVSSFFLGNNFHGILNISSESLAQAQSIATLFEQLGSGGGLWTCPKIRRTRAQVQAEG